MYSNLRIASVLGGKVPGDDVLVPAPGRGPEDRSMRIFPNSDHSDYIAEPQRDDDQATCRLHIVEACLNHVSSAQSGGVGTYSRAADDPKKRTTKFLMSRVTANTSETTAPPAVQ
jgi:hypothetical protein